MPLATPRSPRAGANFPAVIERDRIEAHVGRNAVLPAIHRFAVRHHPCQLASLVVLNVRLRGHPVCDRAVERHRSREHAANRKSRIVNARELHLERGDRDAKVLRSEATSPRPSDPHHEHAARPGAPLGEGDIRVDAHRGCRSRERRATGNCAATRDLHRGHELLDRARIDRLEGELRVVQAELVGALADCEPELAAHRPAVHGEVDVARNVIALARVPHCRCEIHGSAAARGHPRIREAKIGERERGRAQGRVQIAGRHHVPAVAVQLSVRERKGEAVKPERVRCHVDRAVRISHVGGRRIEDRCACGERAHLKYAREAVGIGEAHVRKRGLEAVEHHHALIPTGHCDDVLPRTARDRQAHEALTLRLRQRVSRRPRHPHNDAAVRHAHVAQRDPGAKASRRVPRSRRGGKEHGEIPLAPRLSVDHHRWSGDAERIDDDVFRKKIPEREAPLHQRRREEWRARAVGDGDVPQRDSAQEIPVHATDARDAVDAPVHRVHRDPSHALATNVGVRESHDRGSRQQRDGCDRDSADLQDLPHQKACPIERCSAKWFSTLESPLPSSTGL